MLNFNLGSIFSKEMSKIIIIIYYDLHHVIVSNSHIKQQLCCFVVMAMVFVHPNKWPNWQTYLLPPKWHLFLATLKGMESSSPLKYPHMDLSK
jgi:hypothetical protein